MECICVMKKTICDSCEKNEANITMRLHAIEDKFIIITETVCKVFSGVTQKIDLCFKCADELKISKRSIKEKVE